MWKTAATITSVTSPTPDYAKRPTNVANWGLLGEFAELQAAAAVRALRKLTVSLDETRSRTRQIAVYRDTYGWLTRWRQGLAANGKQRPDARHTPTKLSTPIGDDLLSPDGPNLDRLGTIGRLRIGGQWDDARKVFVGGKDTPASLVAKAKGDAVLARFSAEAPDADVLQNWIALPSGVRLRGNSLLRGAAAAEAANALIERQRASGREPHEFDVGGQLIYARTASTADRAALREAAFGLLADLERHGNGQPVPLSDADARDRFALAVYCMYQGPEFKRGSDATIRTFVAAAHTRIFGVAPILPQDLDLQGYVCNQREFVTNLRTSMGSVGSPSRRTHRIRRPATNLSHTRRSAARAR